MRKIILGYGSLLSAKWWKNTLKRVEEKDLIYTKLKWFKRIWSYTSDIFLTDENKVYGWVFLDIEKDKKFEIDTFWVIVDDEEFEKIRLREKTYDMIDVTENIKNPIKWYRYFTAYLKDKNKKCNKEKVIPWKYLDFVAEILIQYGDEFRKKFYDTTFWLKNFAIKSGNYKFIDDEINKNTWKI